jgi:hypothetical protein
MLRGFPRAVYAGIRSKVEGGEAETGSDARRVAASGWLSSIIRTEY